MGQGAWADFESSKRSQKSWVWMNLNIAPWVRMNMSCDWPLWIYRRLPHTLVKRLIMIGRYVLPSHNSALIYGSRKLQVCRKGWISFVTSTWYRSQPVMPYFYSVLPRIKLWLWRGRLLMRSWRWGSFASKYRWVGAQCFRLYLCMGNVRR